MKDMPKKSHISAIVSPIVEGDKVEFKGADSYYRGHVVAIFKKRGTDQVRCVVQNSDGLLLIKNPKHATIIREVDWQKDKGLSGDHYTIEEGMKL